MSLGACPHMHMYMCACCCTVIKHDGTLQLSCQDQIPAALQSCSASLHAAASPLVKVQHTGQTCTPCSSRPCIYMHRVETGLHAVQLPSKVSSTPCTPHSSTGH
jgi:hypothetical protein